MSMLEVSGLGVLYQTKDQAVRALENVSFSLNRGETLGIIGESGSGKTTLALALMGLLAKKRLNMVRYSVWWRHLGTVINSTVS